MEAATSSVVLGHDEQTEELIRPDQDRMIRSLARQHSLKLDFDKLGSLTKWQASDLISEIQSGAADKEAKAKAERAAATP